MADDVAFLKSVADQMSNAALTFLKSVTDYVSGAHLAFLKSLADHLSNAPLVLLKSMDIHASNAPLEYLANHGSEPSSEFENQIYVYRYDHMNWFIYFMLPIPTNRDIPGV